MVLGRSKSVELFRPPVSSARHRSRCESVPISIDDGNCRADQTFSTKGPDHTIKLAAGRMEGSTAIMIKGAATAELCIDARDYDLSSASCVPSINVSAIDVNEQELCNESSAVEIGSSHVDRSTERSRVAGLSSDLEIIGARKVQRQRPFALGESQSAKAATHEVPLEKADSTPKPESPPPEIISVRKVEHANRSAGTPARYPAKAALQRSNVSSQEALKPSPFARPWEHNVSLKSPGSKTGRAPRTGPCTNMNMHPPNLQPSQSARSDNSPACTPVASASAATVTAPAHGLKRTPLEAAEGSVKRRKMPDTSRIGPRPVTSNQPDRQQKQSNTINGFDPTPRHDLSSGPSALHLAPPIASPPSSGPTLSPNKRWTAGTWTTHQYASLAQACEATFPLAAFCAAHSKSPAEVSEVFSAIIQTPLLSRPGPGPGAAGSGLGEERVRERRRIESEVCGYQSKLRGLQEREREQEAESMRRELEAKIWGRVREEGWVRPSRGSVSASSGPGGEIPKTRGRRPYPVKSVEEATAGLQAASAELQRATKAEQRKAKKAGKDEGNGGCGVKTEDGKRKIV